MPRSRPASGPGSPRRIEVTHFAEQVDRAREKRAERRGRKLVVVAAGPGLVELFAEAGAEVIEGGPGRRPSTGQILAAIEATGAQEVIVLPNDPDSIGVAEAAAHEAEQKGIHVVVIPTRAQVQGIAALAVHEPGRRSTATSCRWPPQPAAPATVRSPSRPRTP